MNPVRRRTRSLAPVVGLLVLAIAMLAMVGTASAAVPTNRNDPCSQAGRNICDTNGVGKYETYRYGIRWFGDFRGAVPGVEGPTFCTDLRFWYPSKAGKFEEMSLTGFRNRNGKLVPLVSQRKMSYALWKYGTSNKVNQQAAVMLYVHRMMGDGRPGEVDPSALGPAVVRLYNRIDREATRLHGPYKLSTQVSQKLIVGVPATATVKLTTSKGTPMAGVRVNLDGENAEVPATARTNGRGIATVRITPSAAARVRVSATTDDIAANLPKVYTPTTAKAKRNGQRLAGPNTQQLTAAGAATARKATVKVSTTARPDKLLVGEQSRDEIRLTGLPTGRTTEVTSLLFGPFRTREAIVCTGEPAARTTVTANRSGTVNSPPVNPAAVGWYTYQVVIPGDDDLNPVTTPCAVPAETFVVETQPVVSTQVSAQQTRPGAEIFDTVKVSGLAGETANVDVKLFGPFAAREDVKCDGAPVWTGTVAADKGDGEYTTAPFTLTTAGYYSYTESIAAAGFVRAQNSECAVASETTVAMGTPAIRTQINKQATAPGDTVTDAAVVSGLGALRATVTAELWGPYPTEAAMTCEGTPYWSGTFTANGDGTYTTDPVKVDRAGYYTYREHIAATEAFDAVSTECAEVSETTITTAEPTVTTVASKEVLRPGGKLFDTLRVKGLGKSPATVEVELFGPFATRNAIRCTGRPVWEGTVRANGDGTYRTTPVTIEKVGLYTYRERIRPDGLVKGFQGECALVAETALAAPTINTGRSTGIEAPGARLDQKSTASSRPTRVRAPQLGVNARVAQAGINLRKGELAVPADIKRAGWWRDGAAPGDQNGATLIAGHVDSAKRGAGAFFGLKRAKAGQRVQVTTANGRTRSYRITSVSKVLKDRLPASIYSLKGRERLVLVTCGGPFDQSTGHYEDNIIVTAVPVSR